MTHIRMADEYDIEHGSMTLFISVIKLQSLMTLTGKLEVDKHDNVIHDNMTKYLLDAKKKEDHNVRYDSSRFAFIWMTKFGKASIYRVCCILCKLVICPI
jgi:hypothetical protein